ncbi:MAG: DUF5715 family protein [Gemmatimonadota bacterium]
MRVERRWVAAGVAVAVAAGGCARAEGARDEAPARAAVAEAAAPAKAATPREVEAARARAAARADSARRAMIQVRGLTREERAELRQDVNARQVALARSLGVRASDEAEIQRLVREGRLVALEDSTEHWVLRDLTYSVPYVTPDTRAMLVEVGRRFHARLDSLGLPRYRMEVTSVLRTPETQAELKSRNSNAARDVSAHEFGTTLDVAHVRFAPPAASALPQGPAQVRAEEAAMLEEVGKQGASALQAELGRVLAEMREERKLRVMMERRQAVYHMTVAQRMASAAD